MPDENNTNTQISTPVGSFSFSGRRTAEFITTILAIGVGIMAFVIWTHAQDLKNIGKDIETRDKLIVRAIEENAGSNRFFACVIAHKQEERMAQVENEKSLCNRMAK